MSRKLVLFDVDWTLLSKPLPPAYGDRFAVALRKVLGIDASENELNNEGMTDKQIIVLLMRMRGLDEKTIKAEVGRVISVMAKYVEDNIEKDNSFHEMPHVTELLAELERRGDVLGLVTGNTEKIARLRLRKIGLAHFFRIGGFGDSSEKRSELVLTAIRKAEEKFKARIRKWDVFVIGDTPRDIACGKEAGVKTIAMATGPCPLNELKKHKPDFAFADFSGWEKLVRAIHSD